MPRTLAQAFPPGDFLAEELAARHWTQSDFAQILDRPAQFVSEIVSGKKEITRESAAQARGRPGNHRRVLAQPAEQLPTVAAGAGTPQDPG